MDTHTLELLQFGRVRSLVASYAASPLGREAALAIEPSTDPGEIRHRQALTTEMTDALAAGLSPPLAGLIDVRGAVRRAAIGATLDAEELADIASTLRIIADVDRWLSRIGDSFPRLGALKQEVGEFSGVANAIDGCLDARGIVLDTASRRLSEIRREIGVAEERIQETLRRMLRSPEIRRILRYPNFTVVGQHYVLPVARDHRGELKGSVHRTSASNETVYIEPQAVAEQSAQLSYLRSKETKEVRRILRWLSAQVGQVAEPLGTTLDVMAGLDLVLCRGRFSLDYRMTPPDLNTEGRILLRGARHPILEHLFREETKRLRAEAEAEARQASDADPADGEGGADGPGNGESDTGSGGFAVGFHQPPVGTIARPPESTGPVRGFHELPVGSRVPWVAPPEFRFDRDLFQPPVGRPADLGEAGSDETPSAGPTVTFRRLPEPEPFESEQELKGGLSGRPVEQRRRERGEAGGSGPAASTRTPGSEAEPSRSRPDIPTREVVPIDLHLGLQFNLLVITGPNTGGKTVALKTVGLLAVMAQCGMHIPAKQGSQVTVLDDVLADIGDEQSLEQSLSTFSSHIRRITEILRKATDRSLVLMDEVGAGTDPAEGAALGRAILDELDNTGCRAIVTTHIGDLKTYAFSNPRAENAAVEFDVETLQPRYRVHIGDIGASNALQIARRLSMPPHLVDRASWYLDRRRQSGEDTPEWEAVQRMRSEAEQARQEAMAQQAEAERTRAALAQKLADLQSQAERDARLADSRARLQPGDRVVVPRLGYDRPGRVVRIDPKKNKAVVAIGQMNWDVTIDELIPQVLKTPEAPTPHRGLSAAQQGGRSR
ncbi:endonuclease MutS2 [Tautonia plasticadhaerens]|uniref:Endonuclease MutS2 n=1 Tax=Tautonia plasticadhaerens TaxID=2527974 RepID=A0A518H8Q1_9BACT|nr:DNA strand exchange inhibitor protein [Tautonia plasticadhaerens]QDV37227.1 Endonuclease MutS2 [Tautonia plasticadhaerens]